MGTNGMTRDQDEDETVRLPILWASFGAFWLPISRLAIFARAAWAPVTLFLVASFGIVGLQVLIAEALLAENAGARMAGGLALISASLNFVGIASSLLLFPAMTAWIRLTIEGPPPDGRFPTWRFGAAEWHFLLRFLLISLIGFGALLGGLVISPSLYLVWWVLGVSAVPLALVAYIYLSARMLPYVGAAAMGHKATIHDAWRMSEGNGFRLFLVVAIFSITVLVTSFLLSAGLFGAATYEFGSLIGADGEIVGLNDPEEFLTGFGVFFVVASLAATMVFVLVAMMYSALIGRVYGRLSARRDLRMADTFD